MPRRRACVIMSRMTTTPKMITTTIHPSHRFISLGEEGHRCQFCDANRGGIASRSICPAAFDDAPERPDVYRPKVVGMVLTDDACIGVSANPIGIVVANGEGEGLVASMNLAQAIRVRDMLDTAINEAQIKRAGEIHLARLAWEKSWTA